MASRFFGMNAGQGEADVVDGATTNSTDVEISVNLANIATKQDLRNALDYIWMYIYKRATSLPAH